MSRWYQSTVGANVLGLLSWLYVVSFMPHALIPFVLLTYNKFVPTYMSLYGFFYLVLFSWPLWKGSLKKFLFDENVAVQEKQEVITEEKAVSKDEQASAASVAEAETENLEASGDDKKNL